MQSKLGQSDPSETRVTHPMRSALEQSDPLGTKVTHPKKSTPPSTFGALAK